MIILLSLAIYQTHIIIELTLPRNCALGCLAREASELLVRSWRVFYIALYLLEAIGVHRDNLCWLLRS